MRLFVFGDSFSENLFDLAYNSKFCVSDIEQYMALLTKTNSDKALWFTDHLENLGYEVFNFGLGGCSNEHIIYQFAKLPDFEENDRIILNWTHPSRFLWIRDNGKGTYVHRDTFINSGETINFFMNSQFINRNESFNQNGYLGQNYIPFLKYFINVHSKYRPIIWTPFNDVGVKFLDSKYYIQTNNNDFLMDKVRNWTIKLETDSFYEDQHFGRYGNYYLAVIIDEIIKSGRDGGYMTRDLFDTIANRIKSENVNYSFYI